MPLFAVETIEPEMLEQLPDFKARLEWFLEHRPHLAQLVSRWHEPGVGERRLIALVRGHRMKRLLARMLDPNEFLSDHGVRSVSKYHEEHPYVFDVRRHRLRRPLRAGRVAQRPVRRQLELARPGLVPDELPADRGAAEVPPLLRRRLHGGVPDRLGPVSHARRRSPTSSRSA